MAGKNIGRTVTGPAGESFLLTDSLGLGAFGEVYRAVGQASGSVVAVKLLSESQSDDPVAEQSLVNEAKLAQEVDHPNVVKVLHSAIDTALGPFLMMEYVPDGTLKRLLHAQAGQPLDLGRVIDIAIQIAQGVRAINQRLIHRDIKPDNILIAGNRFKVADFGISKMVAERTRTRTFKGIGPLSHMAPEAWQFETHTLKLDIYSVGLVFFEMLTLRHPLADAAKGPSLYDGWREAHLYHPVPDVRTLRREVPLPIAQLIARMTSKRPTDRPEWGEVMAVLSSAASGTTGTGPIDTIVERAVARHQELEKETLATERERKRSQDISRLYETSFEQLLTIFDSIADAFNVRFQHGKIARRHIRDGITYELPGALPLQVKLFPRRETGQRVAGGEIIGGAFLGLQQRVSGNLIVVRDDTNDLYGRWMGCLVNLNALVDPRKSLARLSSVPSVTPFGFQTEEDFYDRIVHAGGGMHIFTYDIWPDVRKFFQEFLDTAYTKQGSSRD